MTTFSIIIPVKPGGRPSALEAIRNIDYPSGQFEILVSEGKAPSRQRNMAALEASGDILYFLDDDSRPVSNFLVLCEALFREEKVASVGGPSLTPTDDSCLQRLFGVVLSSCFGAGAVRNRYRSFGVPRVTREQELILCNLAFRRKLFLEMKGFDERLYPNEENELIDRISAAGHKLFHHPAMAVERSQRPSLTAFIRQMYSYGRGRAQQTLLAGPSSALSFVPLAFVCYLLIFPLLPGNFLWAAPLLAYAFLNLVFSLKAVIDSGRLSGILTLFLFPLMHCCNGIGLLAGFIGGRPQIITERNISVRRVKSFEDVSW